MYFRVKLLSHCRMLQIGDALTTKPNNQSTQNRRTRSLLSRQFKDQSSINVPIPISNLEIRDASFPSKPITSTAPHHQTANNYRQLPADYGSLPANYRHSYGFHYKRCYRYWRFTDKAGLFTYRRLQPVMENYRHAVNAVMKSCTSTRNASK